MIPRFLAPRGVLRVCAWLAYWPLAYIAAREPVLAGVLVAGPLVAIVGSRWWATLLGAGCVFAAAFGTARNLAPPVAATAIALVFVGVFAGLIERTGARTEGPLDGNVHAIEPLAFWTALVGVLVALGSRAAHLHAFFPSIAKALALLAMLVAASAVFMWTYLRRWLARIQRGDIPTLRVGSTAEDVAAPPLSNVAVPDAAIVEGATHAAGPYRAGEGRVIARVPRDPRVLRRRYGMLALRASAVGALCVAAAGLVLGPSARLGHGEDLASTPTTLPPFPAECKARPPKLRFAALAPLRVLDIEQIAERYRRAGLDVVLEPPLPYEDRYLDTTRGQLIGEEITATAREAYGPGHDDTLIVVVTDRDMFLRDVDWRYAFATRETGVAVVSIARMDPNFPLLSPSTYIPRREECAATVRARAFRMITRQILLGLCRAETVEDPRSARRRTVLGLSDLDAIDESTY